MSVGFDYEQSEWRRVSRRIGSRHDVRCPVRWRTVAPEGSGGRRRSRRRGSPEPRDALLGDLSVSGALLLVEGGEPPLSGTRIDVEIQGEWARAQVVRAGPASEPSRYWCGVTFLRPGESFMSVIASLTGRGAIEPNFRD